MERNRFNDVVLRKAAEGAEVSYTGWPFLPYVDDSERVYAFEDGVEALFHHVWQGHDELDFWRLYSSGVLYHRQLLREDSGDLATGNHRTLDFIWLIWHVAGGVDCLVRLYSALGLSDDESVSATSRVLGAEGRELWSHRHDPQIYPGHVSRIGTVDASHEATLAEWRAGAREYAVEIVQQIYAKFNWTDALPTMIRVQVDRLLDRKLL